MLIKNFDELPDNEHLILAKFSFHWYFNIQVSGVMRTECRQTDSFRINKLLVWRKSYV